MLTSTEHGATHEFHKRARPCTPLETIRGHICAKLVDIGRRSTTSRVPSTDSTKLHSSDRGRAY